MSSSSTKPVRTYSRRHSLRKLHEPESSALSFDSSVLSVADYENNYSPGFGGELSKKKKRRRIITESHGESGDDANFPHYSSAKEVACLPQRSFDRSVSERQISLPSSSPVWDTDEESFAETVSKRGVKDKGKQDMPPSTRSTSLSSITETKECTPMLDDHAFPSRPTTPTSGPRNFTEIFGTLTPKRESPSKQVISCNSPRNAGLTKRMLSRSHTDSSIETSPSGLASRTSSRTQSLAESFYSERLSRSQTEVTDKTDRLNTESQDSPSRTRTPALQQAQSKISRTYAGSSRSFLVTIPVSGVDDQLADSGTKRPDLNDGDDQSMRNSYSELRKRWGVDASEGDFRDDETGSSQVHDEGLALYNPLSSITDLRTKGESRRFLDEVGYLFEGLEPSAALGVRRNSALDIISNLCDQDFWRKSKAAGLLPKVWDLLCNAGAGTGDKILDPILSCFASLASNDPRDVSIFADAEGFTETIIRLVVMHAKHDPLLESAGNTLHLSKPEKAMLTRLRGVISKSPSLLCNGCRATSRLLLSNVFSLLPPSFFPHMSTILDSVSPDLASVKSRLSAYRSGLPLFPDDPDDHESYEKLCFEHIYNCLNVLDLYLLQAENVSHSSSLSKLDIMERYPTLHETLIGLIVIANILEDSAYPARLRSQSLRCSELAFRIIINLTNGSRAWSDRIANNSCTLPIIIRLSMLCSWKVLSPRPKDEDETADGENDATRAMDRLCLALGLLTNLVQEQDDLCTRLLNLSFDMSCSGHSSCLLGCRCPNGVNAVLGIIDIYASLLKSEEHKTAPDMHFLRGHVAVLLGLLLLQAQKSSESDMRSVIEELPGPYTLRKKLDTLIADIDDFSGLYETLTSREIGAAPAVTTARDDGNEGGSTNHHRFESNIVAEVVHSLKALRKHLTG